MYSVVQGLASKVNLRFGLMLGALLFSCSALEAQNSRVDALAQDDPTGSVLTLTAVTVVFLALILLAVIFTLIGRFMHRTQQKKTQELRQPNPEAEYVTSLLTGGNSVKEPAPEALVAISLALRQAGPGSPTQEEALAIALSLASHQTDLHDHESYRLTLNPRRQTPWNARAFGLRREVQRVYTY